MGTHRSPTWLPFTSSHRSHHRRIPPKDTVLTYSRTVASQLLLAWSQSLPSKRGSLPVRNTLLPTWRYCRLRRFTVAHKHGMWLVLFNSWFKGQPRTGLNRHRRGYATKEAGSAVHFPVSGPIGLARSQFLNLSNSSSLIITSCTSTVLRSYFITTGTIALSIAYGPILVIREYQGMKNINPTSCN